MVYIQEKNPFTKNSALKQNEMLIQGAYDASEGKKLASAMEGADENIDEFEEDTSKEKEIEKLTKTYMQQQNQG